VLMGDLNDRIGNQSIEEKKKGTNEEPTINRNLGGWGEERRDFRFFN